jgi:hypothetical protein
MRERLALEGCQGQQSVRPRSRHGLWESASSYDYSLRMAAVCYKHPVDLGTLIGAVLAAVATVAAASYPMWQRARAERRNAERAEYETEIKAASGACSVVANAIDLARIHIDERRDHTLMGRSLDQGQASFTRQFRGGITADTLLALQPEEMRGIKDVIERCRDILRRFDYYDTHPSEPNRIRHMSDCVADLRDFYLNEYPGIERDCLEGLKRRLASERSPRRFGCHGRRSLLRQTAPRY